MGSGFAETKKIWWPVPSHAKKETTSFHILSILLNRRYTKQSKVFDKLL